MVSQHKELKLIRGVPIIPGLTTTLEPGTDLIINLLSGEAEGFALNPSPGSWDPGLPAPKSGLWQDVPFVDGRTPIADAYQNVTETMQLTLSAPNFLLLSRWLSKLALLAQDIEQFWSMGNIQPSPVYIHWWATDAPGPQFALIMSLDFAVTAPGVTDAGKIIRDVTLTIEREPYWRGVAPGATPMLWTFYTKNILPGSGYNANNLPSLMSDGASLHEQTFANADIYQVQSVTQNTPSSVNVITIPASKLPGDVPPLICVGIKGTRSGGDLDTWSFMLASTSRPLTFTGSDGNTYRVFGNIPHWMNDLALGAKVNDTGGIPGYNVLTSAFVATNQRHEITTWSGVFAEKMIFKRNISVNLQRGRYAVFLRCRQNAATFGDIQVKLLYQTIDLGAVIETTPVSPPVIAGTGDTARWPLLYMGTISLPEIADFEITQDNKGIYQGTVYSAINKNNGRFLLQALRSAGAANLYVRDLLLMPIDEGFLNFEQGTPLVTGSYAGSSFLVDSTGYLSRGKPGTVAMLDDTTNVSGGSGMINIGQLSGSDLILQPGVDNNLFFAIHNENFYTAVPATLKAYVNIVPRWMGVRDI